MTQDTTDSLTLVTAPTAEPVTLAEAKTFLRIEHTADDAVITRAISAAREAAEQYLRCALLPQTWDYTIAHPYRCEVRLPFGPAQSITSVISYNEAGATTTLATTAYSLSVDGSRVMFTNAPSAAKLVIRYSASLAADVATLPALIKQGMLHHIAAMLEQREGAAPMPVQAIACFMPYRRVML